MNLFVTLGELVSFRWCGLLGLVMLLSHCATEPTLPDLSELDKSAPDYENPYPEGTYLHFLGRKDYPKTYDTFKNQDLMAIANGKNSKIEINLKDQRGQLLVNGEVAMDFPTATGIRSFPTPTGDYQVLEKERSGKASNKYGKIYDAEDKLVNGDADISSDEVPEGGKFVGAPMPLWMRLTWDGIGLHVGKVPRRPASHGCLRLQRGTAKTLFDIVELGTPVTIR